MMSRILLDESEYYGMNDVVVINAIMLILLGLLFYVSFQDDGLIHGWCLILIYPLGILIFTILLLLTIFYCIGYMWLTQQRNEMLEL
jgi:hypothetical protein